MIESLLSVASSIRLKLSTASGFSSFPPVISVTGGSSYFFGCDGEGRVEEFGYISRVECWGLASAGSTMRGVVEGIHGDIMFCRATNTVSQESELALLYCV